MTLRYWERRRRSQTAPFDWAVSVFLILVLFLTAFSLGYWYGHERQTYDSYWSGYNEGEYQGLNFKCTKNVQGKMSAQAEE